MEQGGGELPVGFVGLGQMGRALVARLRDVGVPSIVFNRTRTNVESLLSEKIQWAESPAEVGRRAASGIVFLMPSDAKALKSLTFGRRGLARGARQDSLVVNLSTITPDDARSIATRFGERHIRYLDCPVGGSVEAARNGQLSLFVGGEEADAARARPFLEKIGASISLVGPVGAGSSMKLVNNVLTIGQVALISEAIALGETLGLDREQVLRVLSHSGARSEMLENKRAAWLKRDYAPQFRMALARKDLGLIERSARSRNSVRIAHEVRRLLDEAIDAGLENQDFSAVYEVERTRAELPAAPPPSTSSSQLDSKTS